MPTPPLSPALESALRVVLDTLVPARPDADVPAAGELGLAPEIWERFGEGGPALAEGLAALDAFAMEALGERFDAIARAEREPLLRRFDAEQPTLLGGLVFHTYAVYYHHPRVMEAIGLEGRAPFPKGYELEPGDLSGLEAVRARGPRYRRA